MPDSQQPSPASRSVSYCILYSKSRELHDPAAVNRSIPCIACPASHMTPCHLVRLITQCFATRGQRCLASRICDGLLVLLTRLIIFCSARKFPLVGPILTEGEGGWCCGGKTQSLSAP